MFIPKMPEATVVGIKKNASCVRRVTPTASLIASWLSIMLIVAIDAEKVASQCAVTVSFLFERVL